MSTWWRVCLLLLPLLCVPACGTKANPAVNCTDGTCSDPSFPFCDVDGVIGGEPGTCIAVVCHAGDIGGCSGSAALVCNAAGTGFDMETCAAGCEDQTGCNACAPSSSACVGDTFSTCDAHGNVASSVQCDLGCSTDGTRCAQMVPSNGVGAAVTGSGSAQDLDLENGTLDLTAGTFTRGSGGTISVPIISIDAQPGGLPIRVVVAHTLLLNNVSVSSGSGSAAVALAFVAVGRITVSGQLRVTTKGTLDGCRAGASVFGMFGSTRYASGAGGGGFASEGGAGGSIGTVAIGGAGGPVAGNEELSPLRGGCDGGDAANTLGGSHRGGPGGGALQLTSFEQIDVSATISVDGRVAPSVLNGDNSGNNNTAGGGGAGGGLILEAPVVQLADTAHLLARGAGGTSGGQDFGVATDSSAIQPGGVCTADDAEDCLSNGGDGAAPSASGSAGGSYDPTMPNARSGTAGAGGGGNGRIRFNTRDGKFVRGDLTLLTGSVSSGNLTAR